MWACLAFGWCELDGHLGAQGSADRVEREQGKGLHWFATDGWNLILGSLRSVEYELEFC